MLPGRKCPAPAPATRSLCSECRRVRAMAMLLYPPTPGSLLQGLKSSSVPLLSRPLLASAHGLMAPPAFLLLGRRGDTPSALDLAGNTCLRRPRCTRPCKQTGHPMLLKTTRSCLGIRPPPFVLSVTTDWFELFAFKPQHGVICPSGRATWLVSHLVPVLCCIIPHNLSWGRCHKSCLKARNWDWKEPFLQIS